MDILNAVTAGVTKPTQIMYRSNTSWTVLQDCLESLTQCGFLRRAEEHSRTEYTATDRGFAVVHDYLRLLDVTRARPT